MTPPTDGALTPSLPVFITIAEAALLSGTSPSTIRRMVARQELQVTYFGHHPRVVTASLFQGRAKPD